VFDLEEEILLQNMFHISFFVDKTSDKSSWALFV